MGAGAILAEARTGVGDAETAGELHDRLAVLGAPLLPGVLDQLEAGTVKRVEQDAALATRAPKLSREKAWVDFGKGAREVSARIRGMSPWPGVRVEVVDGEGKVRTVATVLKCRAVEGGRHEPEKCGVVLGDRTVACGEGRLELITVQPAGKKAMELGAFANGYGLAAGARLRSVVAPPG
jgi:methionyl-tRNA formyltransferase